MGIERAAPAAGSARRLFRLPSPAVPQQYWRPWTVVLPGVLALVWSGLLILADGAMGMMADWDTPMRGSRWVSAALAGHCLLGLTSAVLLASGLGFPAWRKSAAIAAWLIIPVGFGWLMLTGRLIGSS